MRTNRLLDLTNLVALSPAKHFFNGLLGASDDFFPFVAPSLRRSLL